MKHIRLLLAFATILALFSCQENDMSDYTGKDAVYFQYSSDWSDSKDSIVYSFAGKESNEGIVNLQVNLMGNTTDYDRTVKLTVATSQTTAKEGLHYKALENAYMLKAGENQVIIPITVYNTDESLETTPVKLVVDLAESDDLSLGIKGRTRAVITISNILSKPSWWDEANMDYYMGSYSKVKHEYCIRILGQDFPANYDGFFDTYEYWQQAGVYMSQYFKENYPIYDENGNAIEPW